MWPLLAPGLERWAEVGGERRDAPSKCRTWWPVPQLAAVVLAVAAAQARALRDALRLVPLFAAFLVVAAALAWTLARWLALPPEQGRTLAYGFGTRNSFVVLPFAPALPPPWDLAAMVIAVQSLVELLAMVAWLWWVPQRLFPPVVAARTM